MPGHFSAKDESNFLWLSDGSVPVEQALGELVDGGAAEEDQVVAKLDLGKEEPVLTAGLSPFLGGEEGSKGPRTKKMYISSYGSSYHGAITNSSSLHEKRLA